jgi:putative colanic acid biosynthesis acetyltransferase WcaF
LQARSSSTVDLSRFDNSWYRPGRSTLVRVLWLLVSRVCFETSAPWPSLLKTLLLRAFGGRVGVGVVIKPRVKIKYPWHLDLGDHCWIGEDAWLDSLGPIVIGPNACLSQGVMIETGNHDWSKTGFDLIVRGVTLEEGAWAAVRSLLLPGSRLSSHSVLAAAGVLSGVTESYSIYAGNPAVRIKSRAIND